MATEHTVIFQPLGVRGKVPTGKNLLDVARDMGVDMEGPCGGAMTCGKCRVRIEEGFFEKFGIDSRASHLTEVTEHEKRKLKDRINDNYRLACATEVRGDVLIYVPEESQQAKQVVLETGVDRIIDLRPTVQCHYVQLTSATLEDHRDDWSRLRDALRERQPQLPANLRIDFAALRSLPQAIREGDWAVTVAIWQGEEVLGVFPGLKEEIYGIGVDIGTTTVAAFLCNLRTGQLAARASSMNPQVRYGEDVLSRITYSMMNDDGLQNLHSAIIECLNELVLKLTKSADISRDDVVEMTLAFNTAMHHIALKLEPDRLGRSPFPPVISEGFNLKARDLGLNIAPGGSVYCLPNEAGFVGADNVAVLIAEAPYEQEEQILLIDIGTNGEIVLGNKEQLFSTSCATGPALEGAQIKHGMRAAPGAIEKVRIDEDLECHLRIIGHPDWIQPGEPNEARGICGSGIVDVVAHLYLRGIIQPNGRFNLDLKHPRVRVAEDGKPEYVLVWAEQTKIGKEITITQGDVRAIQLAKAALYTGAEILMQKLGISRVDRVVLAGAFGSYIDPESALLIGMFPDCPLESVIAVGNAAGDGARIALLNRDKRVEAERVARETHFVETAVEPDFQERFVLAMAFPHAQHSFPSIEHLLRQVPGRLVQTGPAAASSK